MYEATVGRRAPEVPKQRLSIVAFDGERKVQIEMQPALQRFKQRRKVKVESGTHGNR